MFQISSVKNSSQLNERNILQSIKLFNKFKIAVTNTFFNYSENLSSNLLASVEGLDLSKNNQRAKGLKERSIIANKENIFLQNIISKLTQISKKSWSKVKNQQKISIYMEVMNGLEIFKKRFPCCSYTPNYAQGKFEINQNWIFQQIENMIYSIDNYYRKQKNEDKRIQQQILPFRNINSASNKTKAKNNDVFIKKILFQQHQIDNQTRTNTDHRCSNSQAFMQNYLKNVKSKDGLASTFARKYKSMHEEQLKNERNETIQKNILRSRTAKLNQRSKLVTSQTRKTIEQFKSYSIIKDLNSSSLYKRNKNHSKKSQNNRTSEDSQYTKGRIQYDKNYIKNAFGRNNKKNILLKQDQEHKSHSGEKLKNKKIVKIDNESINDQQKHVTKQVKLQNQNKKILDKSRSRRGKLRRGILNRKRNIKQKSVNFSRQLSKHTESCNVIVIECLQNQQEQFDKQIDSISLKGDKQENCDSQSMISQHALVSAFQCFQLKNNDKRTKVLKNHPNRLIKRSAILLKPGQLLFPSKQRVIQKKVESSSSVQNSKSIFKQLYELNQQIKKENERHENGFSSVLYNQLQKLQALQQNRKKLLYKERDNRSELDKTYPFNLICQSQVNKVQNIQQYERQNSFLTDQDWIKRHWGNSLANQLLQK